MNGEEGEAQEICQWIKLMRFLAREDFLKQFIN